MTNSLQTLKDAWADPGKRKLVMYAGAAAVLGVMWVGMGGSGGEKGARTKTYKTQEGSVFGVAKSADSIGQVDTQDLLKEMTDQFAQKEKELNSREAKLNKTLEDISADLLKNKSELFTIQEQMKALSQVTSKEMQADRLAAGSTQFAPANVKARVGGEQQALNVLDAQGNILQRRQTQIVTAQQPPIEGKMIRTITQRNVRVVRESGTIEQQDVKTTNISQRNQNVLKEKVESKPADIKQSVNGGNEGEFALTMGSILTGVLINGVNAPTSSNGQKDPMPVLMRIKREALMPNNFTLDVVDCHLLGSAVGDLSTSRAYIRAEAISCITEDGKAIEKNITAYAVSSADGSTGIPGDVIFKSGAMIANALKAEFLAGFGKALSPQRVQSLNVNPGDTSLWQSQDMGYAGKAGAMQGVGGAAERLADYYLKMAEQAHPTIEIMPGIEVEFIVQRGMTMKLESTSDAPADGRATLTQSNAVAPAPSFQAPAIP